MWISKMRRLNGSKIDGRGSRRTDGEKFWIRLIKYCSGAQAGLPLQNTVSWDATTRTTGWKSGQCRRVHIPELFSCRYAIKQ